MEGAAFSVRADYGGQAVGGIVVNTPYRSLLQRWRYSGEREWGSTLSFSFTVSWPSVDCFDKPMRQAKGSRFLSPFLLTQRPDFWQNTGK
jgi:hypothetical protein